MAKESLDIHNASLKQSERGPDLVVPQTDKMLPALAAADQGSAQKSDYTFSVSEDPNRIRAYVDPTGEGYSWFTRMGASAQAFFFVLIGLCFVTVFCLCLKLMFHDGAAPLEQALSNNASNWLLGLGIRNTTNMGEVLDFLPWAAIACTLTTSVVAFISARSRSRRIDWTDSHLLLEYSGPVSLALKWASIKSVDQAMQWELFHGKQSVFVLKTHMGKVFRLRISDITHKHNIGEFFSLIKTNASKAALNVSQDFARENSFTELWLKYFSTPAERNKGGLLQKDMELDGGRYKVVGTIGGGGGGTAYLAVVQDFFALHAQSSAKPNDENQPARIGDSEGIAPTEQAERTEHIITANTMELNRLNEVVLKEYVLPMHRGQLTAERTADKLRAEASILEHLHHEQIVRLLDAFIEDYRGYLVMEYVHGETLKSIVERTGPLTEELVIELASQVCDVLQYLHEQTPPVVHRDIAPDNLILQDDGSIKIVDFNVACQVDSSATATVVGKHAYIPAEQFRGKPCPQSDIYALGGTMFFLLTGQEPEPISVSHPLALNNKVSRELDEIIATATADSLAKRFGDVTQMKEALGKLQHAGVKSRRK